MDNIFKYWWGQLFRDRWAARGVRIAHHMSTHRRATHPDRFSTQERAKRKTKQQMTKKSRRRNRHM